MLMIARTLLVPALALTVGLLLVAACGGDDGGQPLPGRLTDSRSVPTATPWAQPPTPITLDSDILTPAAQETGEEDLNGGQVNDQVTPGECGDTYTVQSGDVPFTIAQTCGVEVSDLLELNGIDDPTSLSVGQELKIPQ